MKEYSFDKFSQHAFSEEHFNSICWLKAKTDTNITPKNYFLCSQCDQEFDNTNIYDHDHKDKVKEEHLVISPAEVILDPKGDSQFLKRKTDSKDNDNSHEDEEWRICLYFCYPC